MDLFSPDSAGAFPVIHVKLADLKNPDLPSCVTLRREVIAVVWRDYAALLAREGLPVPAVDARAPHREVRPPEGC
ncbi:MAG TPA: hypothetical protein VNJ71_06565 [Gemmatimonadales bacterium]|jgi:hypothetical protein|nr:hypothetical protein [Gemmatimonadales bacterium]